jgi:tripartite-type tricarboxylate transporter receptor subunit TctC
MKRVLAAGFAASLTLFAGIAAAQPYPARQVRVIIPYTVGGGADAAARLVADHLSRGLGQAFVIDPRPGGNTVIGAEAAAKAPADGYTLFVTGGSTMSIQPFVFQGKLPYDPLGDFAPVSMISRFPFFFVVPSTLGVNTLAEFVAYVKARPGQLSYASNGSGGLGHLGTEMLRQALGLDLAHVPYKGFGPMLPDVLAGRVAAVMMDLAPLGSNARSGAVKFLAVTSSTRSSFMPEVPTVAELAIPGYEIDVWFALYAPAKTPVAITSQLNAEMRKYLGSPEAKEAYAKLGHEPMFSTPDYVRTRIVNEQKLFAPAVKAANLKPE